MSDKGVYIEKFRSGITGGLVACPRLSSEYLFYEIFFLENFSPNNLALYIVVSNYGE